MSIQKLIYIYFLKTILFKEITFRLRSIAKYLTRIYLEGVKKLKQYKNNTKMYFF